MGDAVAAYDRAMSFGDPDTSAKAVVSVGLIATEGRGFEAAENVMVGVADVLSQTTVTFTARVDILRRVLAHAYRRGDSSIARST